MGQIAETISIKDDSKFPLLFRQGVRVRPDQGHLPHLHRKERMQRWQHRLERLFARQEY